MFDVEREIPRGARVRAYSVGDDDADVFRTATEHGITNSTLRVNCEFSEDRGLILGRLYHNEVRRQHGRR